MTDDIQIEQAAKRDPLSYGISYINLLENQEWTLSNRKWSESIYDAVNPYKIERHPDSEPRQMALIKPTQIGMSTMALTKMFHFADFWPGRTIYMLPRQQDYFDFVNTRIDPMITASSRLKAKLGKPDSTRAKGFGESFLFFMESTVEPRMMPADMLMIDEIDLCDPTNVGTANNRLDNSSWKMKFFFGTPTIPNYGSHGQYSLSNQNKWLVKCPGCNFWQEMDWDINLKVVGNPERPEDVHLRCAKCNRRLTVQDINDNGAWVPEKPDVTNMIGFQISQLMVFPIEQIYENWIDPKQTIVEFYRKRLGKTYETAGGSVSREDILANCFSAPYNAELFPDRKSKYFMGLDQGNEIQVVIGKQVSSSSRLQIVHIELIPYESADGRPAGFSRVGNLMKQFNITKAVFDANPNRHSVRDLQKNFMGKIIIADYTPTKDRMIIKKDEKGIQVGVSLNRTEVLDEFMNSIRDGSWGLFGFADNPNTDVEIWISHVTALKRDIEPRKKLGGIIEDVPVWRTLRPDHLAHASSYLRLAVELSGGRVGRFVEIGKQGSSTPMEDPGDGDYPEPAILSRLVPVLSQVRQEQATLYFEEKEKYEQDDSFRPKLPMPLRHCLNKAVEAGFELEHIEWVLKHISEFDNAPIVHPSQRNKRGVRIA